MGVVFLIVIIVIAVWVLASCVRIVPQAYAVILERLGAYQATWSTGIHFKVPFIERVARKVNLKEQVVDFPPQPVITKDNVTMQIDTVVFFQITDPKLYTYGVENPIMAIENLSATTLRNIIGDMELDETLTSRETINTKMRASLDEATDPWGIKVNRVELKNIIPPAAIQDAMEKQMKAERERREAILIAEGQKKSTILVAEGKKQSAILDAEAEKQAAILRAEAQKERMIKEAEGQADLIVGGTGFYIQSVLYNIDFTENDSPNDYRKKLEILAKEKGAEYLHTMLTEVDPKSALQIHTNNIKRTIRALEFYHQTGMKISEHNEAEREKESPYQYAYFVLTDDRAKLYERIDRRVDLMMESGLEEEVRFLKDRGVSSTSTAMQGLGYKELYAYMNGEYSLEEAVRIIKRDTRHFAKRQLTWFKREKDVTWIDRAVIGDDEEHILDFMIEELRKKQILV